MGSHPAVRTPPVGRVGQEYPILQTHSNSRMEGSEKGTPLSLAQQGELSVNSWRVTTNCSLMKEYTPPIFCQERATLSWDRGSEIEQAFNPHWVETKKAILETLSATRHLLQKMEAHPVGQVDRRGVVP